MNKKLLVVAVAAALVAPLSAQAELKLSGTIQAEVGSLQVGDGERTTVSADNDGALAGGGPNKIRLDFDEKLSPGLTAFGRVDWSFDTAESASGTNLGDREHFIGLKGSNVHFKFGRIEGAYKGTGVGDVDPLYGTGVQGRSLASGMTAGNAFAHSSFVNNVVELGFNHSGFSAVVQATVDETADNKDAGQLGLQYKTENWGAFLAGSYTDFGNVTNTGGDDQDGNAKVGGWYKMGGLKLGLQYEMAKLNSTTLDGNEGDYIMGSATYGMGNVIIAGWVAGYMSDADEEDALSFSLAAIYAFSKRTIAYAGYHDTNSDNDTRDWDVFAVGMRHSF